MNTTNKCAPVAYVSHAAGCPVYTANVFVRNWSTSPWIPAIIQIGIGIYIAFKGKIKFDVAAPLFTFFTVTKILIFYGAYHDWMEDGKTELMVIIASIIVGVIAGHIVQK